METRSAATFEQGVFRRPPRADHHAEFEACEYHVVNWRVHAAIGTGAGLCAERVAGRHLAELSGDQLPHRTALLPIGRAAGIQSHRIFASVSNYLSRFEGGERVGVGVPRSKPVSNVATRNAPF